MRGAYYIYYLLLFICHALRTYLYIIIDIFSILGIVMSADFNVYNLAIIFVHYSNEAFFITE